MVLMCPLPWMIFGSTNKFRVIIENIRRMVDNEIFCQPFVFFNLYLQILFYRIKARTSLHRIQITMPHNQRFRKLSPQLPQQSKQRTLLLQGTSILRLSFRIQPAFVANTYRMCVMVPAMCPNLFKRPSPMDFPVTCDIEMITDVTKSPVVDMV